MFEEIDANFFPVVAGHFEALLICENINNNNNRELKCI